MPNEVLKAIDRNLQSFRHVSQEAEPVGVELGSTWYRPSTDTTYKLVNNNGTVEWESLSGSDMSVSVSDPLPTDDVVNGHTVGEIWINSTTDRCFLLADETAGSAVWIRMLNANGDSMSGTLVLNADPVNLMEAATKQYVDAASGGVDVEGIQDIVGAMFNGTQNGVSATYDDPSGKININVNDPTVALSGAVTGSQVMTDLNNVTVATTISSINNITDVDTAASAHGDVFIKQGVEWRSSDTLDGGVF
jgi:hypothetical protein